MIPVPKEQTVFRFDPEMLVRMKRRAKSLNVSLNRYVTQLISEDLIEAGQFPAVSLDEVENDIIMEYAGSFRLPSQNELANDERLSAIWNR